MTYWTERGDDPYASEVAHEQHQEYLADAQAQLPWWTLPGAFEEVW